MVAIMVFNLTDTYFVSRLGTDALAAMGFTFPVVMIVGALAIGFSTGAASIISRALGAGNKRLAARSVSDGLFLTIAGTVVVSLAGYFGIDPLFRMLGASGPVLELTREYMQIWFLGAVVAIMPPVSDGCLRAAGDMVRPLLVMCTCAIGNIILDPILIFGYGPVPAMGIKGAAWATVIARIFGMTASLSFLHYHHRLIDWSRPHLREMLHPWREIFRLGIPSAVTQVLNPVAQGFYIRLAVGTAGAQAVAAMATGTRIENLLFIVPIAYGIAIVPFVGQNYGAEAHSRVQDVRRISTRFALLFSLGTLALLIPFARPLAHIFSSDPEVIHLSTLYLCIATLGHAGFYISNWMGPLLSTIGKPRPVMIIGLMRVFAFIIPLSLAGSHWLGFTGLVAGLALGNLCAGVLAYLMARDQLRAP